MERIVFEHGGEEYDRRYPDGIPTSLTIVLDDGTELESGMVMYPSGHARNTSANLEDILHHKAEALGSIALANADSVINQFGNIANLDVAAIGSLMDFKILNRPAID